MIKTILAKARSQFLKNIIILLSGTVIAQSINIITTPLVTRLYSPEEYGTFSLYSSVASFFTIIATGRYELAIVLPKKEKDALSLVVLCFLITFGLSIFFLLILFIMKSLVSFTLNTWMFLIPVSIFATGIMQTFYYWHNRFGNYKSMSISRINQSIVGNIMRLFLGWNGASGLGLIFSQILGLLSSAVYLLTAFLRDYPLGSRFYKRINCTQIFRVLRAYKDMPIYNSLHALIDMAKLNGISILFSVYYGSHVLGVYAFTMQMIQSPLGIIGTAISRVYIQKATQLFNANQSITNLLLKVVIRLSLISIFIFVPLIIFGEEIFSFVFGEEWREAGIYSEILAPWIFITFITSPISQTTIILNKQKVAFFYSLVQSLLMIISVFVMAFFVRDITHLLRIISIVGSFTGVIYGYWIFTISNSRKYPEITKSGLTGSGE